MKLLIFFLVVVCTGSQVKRCSISTADRHKVTETLFGLANITVQADVNCNNFEALSNSVLESEPSNSVITMWQKLFNENVGNWPIAVKEKFLNRILNTPVMARLSLFLSSKGCLQNTSLKTKLRSLWFDTYTRRNKDSSAFKHVFLGEKFGKEVIGFHNWVKFINEQNDGYLKYGECSTHKNMIVELKDLNWTGGKLNGGHKHESTMFLFTTPELEMALYTICFLGMPRKKCSVMLNNNQFDIQTCEMPDIGVISTAYPMIPGG